MRLTRGARLPRRLADLVPLVLWMGLIFWLSSRSVLIQIESDSGEKLVYKTAHMLAYAVLAWLWWRAISPRRRLTWPILSLAVALTVLYGISDEIHQLFVPERHGQLADVLFDTGGALAMALFLRLTRLRSSLLPVGRLAGDFKPNSSQT